MACAFPPFINSFGSPRVAALHGVEVSGFSSLDRCLGLDWGYSSALFLSSAGANEAESGSLSSQRNFRTPPADAFTPSAEIAILLRCNSLARIGGAGGSGFPARSRYTPGVSGLFGSHILEAAAGLALVYLLLALFCTTANEWIASLLHSRATTLRAAIHELLEGNFAAAFYEHPLIAGLVRNGSHPSYLPANAFSRAVLDLAALPARDSLTFEGLVAGIGNLPPGHLQSSLLALVRHAEGDLAHAQANIETWFDDAMDRASGWYKRRTQWITLLLAASLTILLNADTLAILHRLWSGKQDALMGWTSFSGGAGVWAPRIIGWLLTVGALSLGAPFWFDVLNRFMNLRAASKINAGK